MNQLVQAAIAAARQGNKPKAVELIREVLCANPNDVEAWLVLSRLVDQPERKRQCLNRVLTLDVTNKIAREELLKMDRAAMGASPAPAFVQSSLPLTSSSIPSSELPTIHPDPGFTPVVSVTPRVEPQVRSPLQKSTSARKEKPLVFKYPIFWRILIYFSLASFGCVGLLVASQNVVNSLPFWGLALLMGLTALAFSSKVEISETGIRASTAFTSSEINWNDINRLKSSSIKQRLELFKSNGQVVKVSSQVGGYPRIVEIIRQKRPDLFGMPASPQENVFTSGYEQTSSNSYGSSIPISEFPGTKNFEKSFFRQYGSYFLIVPFCLLAVWTAFTDLEHRIGASIAVIFCLVLMILPLLQVSAIKVEPNKLTVETLFEQKEFSARQIKDIKMQSVRGRHGRVTNFVNIVPVEGKKYPLGGFSVGEEILYGFLTNWWNTYRNR